MKKLFISLIAGAFIVVSLSGCSSNNDNASQNNENELKVALVDEKDNNENANENNTITIDEEETPKAIVTKDKSITNLTIQQLNTIRTSLYNSVNKYREENSKDSVTNNAPLQKTGDIRAKEIIQKWSHTRPNGKSWTTVLTANGISTKELKTGENLAKITATAKSTYSSSYINQIAETLHTSLINSPTHRSVILNGSYCLVGVGITSEIKNGELTIYVTEHFKNNPSSKSSKKNVSKLKYSTVSNKTYTGKAIKPGITVKDGSKTLKNGKDYTLTYSANKNPGKATITIKGKGNYTGSVKKTFNIVPKAPSLKVASSKKSAKVTTKSTGANGYVIEYSLKKNMSGKKSVTITKTSGTIKKLTSKKTYYIRVRAYKTIGGKKYYSPYSSVKSVKVK